MMHGKTMVQDESIESYRCNCMLCGLILAAMRGRARVMCSGCPIRESKPRASGRTNTAINKLTSSHAQPRLGRFAAKFGAGFEPKLRQLRRCSAGKADSCIGAGSFH